ncbi:MAG: hypothetical protein JW816_00060 [Candidatus Buchananbacteria bacterium]|nr:hypothetical protein [Candidatus Buchananbacteria bacterium]
MSNIDTPLRFHKSIDDHIDTFRNIITSLTWLKVSVAEAEKFYQPYPYIIELDCSVTDKKIKASKSILKIIAREGFNKETPFYSATLINYYRIFTIAIKDVLWNEPDFQSLRQKEEMQFLRHIRNASAHENKFFWGHGEKQRQDCINRLPVSWRGKTIKETMENDSLYMNFMNPGDIFFLLSDISNLA